MTVIDCDLLGNCFGVIFASSSIIMMTKMFHGGCSFSFILRISDKKVKEKVSSKLTCFEKAI